MGPDHGLPVQVIEHVPDILRGDAVHEGGPAHAGAGFSGPKDTSTSAGLNPHDGSMSSAIRAMAGAALIFMIDGMVFLRADWYRMHHGAGCLGGQ